MFDLLKESYLIPKRFHGKNGENPVLLTDPDGNLLKSKTGKITDRVFYFLDIICDNARFVKYFSTDCRLDVRVGRRIFHN